MAPNLRGERIFGIPGTACGKILWRRSFERARLLSRALSKLKHGVRTFSPACGRHSLTRSPEIVMNNPGAVLYRGDKFFQLDCCSTFCQVVSTVTHFEAVSDANCVVRPLTLLSFSNSDLVVATTH
jgi:hypothetical protein